MKIRSPSLVRVNGYQTIVAKTIVDSAIVERHTL